MRRTITGLSIASGLILVLCSSISAQTVVINHTNRGWYDDTGSSLPNNLSYAVGDYRGGGCVPCVGDMRNFIVFDLSGVSQPIVSAKIAGFIPGPTGYQSGDPSENLELHDVITPIATLINGAGGLAAHADLGSGVVYGSRTMTNADEGSVVEIELNAAAIAALNSSHGLFGIGGSITTLDSLPNAEFTFGNGRGDITELRLTLVPEPGCLALAIFGAMIFGVSRSRTRYSAK